MKKMVPVFEPVFLYLSAGSLRRRGRLRRCGADSWRHTRGGDPDRRRDDGARPGDGDLPAGDCGGRR